MIFSVYTQKRAITTKGVFVNKILFVSLSLLISTSTFSMEKEEQQDIELENTQTRVEESPESIKPFDTPQEILKNFIAQTERTDKSMNMCLEMVSSLDRFLINNQNAEALAKKSEFDIEVENFKQASNNLYGIFLIPKSKSCKICVASPRFYEFIKQTKDIQTHANTRKDENKNDQAHLFYNRVSALLESLQLAKNRVEKK